MARNRKFDQFVEPKYLKDDSALETSKIPNRTAVTTSLTPFIPIVLEVITAAGADNTVPIVVVEKMIVTDVHMVNLGAGASSDTVQVKNGSTAITDAMDANKSAGIITRAAFLSAAGITIAAGGTINVVALDNTGDDLPQIAVYITGYKSA